MTVRTAIPADTGPEAVFGVGRSGRDGSPIWRRALRLGRVAGIEVRVRFTWVAFAAITLALTVGYLPGSVPRLTPIGFALFAMVATSLLLASVLAHELSHSLVARARGMRVRGITLFVLGGFSEIEGEVADPLDELLVFSVGPAASLALAAFFHGLGALPVLAPPAVAQSLSGLPATDLGLLAIPSYLATINLVLAMANLVPGLPLDGGRMLRALIWKATGDARAATGWASAVGQGFAFVLLGLGVVQLVGGSYLGAAWNLFIAGFLYRVAAGTRREPTLGLVCCGGIPSTGTLVPEPVAVVADAPVGPRTTLSASKPPADSFAVS